MTTLFPKSAKSALPAQVAQARTALLGTLRELDPAAATWVADTDKSRASTPSVVVVGETKRGKSSLVNALLASPNLSPVDAEVATATYLVFGYADAWTAQACYPGQLPPVPIELPELARWTSVTHELPDGQLPPRYVEVSGPCPLLQRISVVDTPGVGGLDSMHGELAREAAARATALLFVVDASAPFTSSELAFLRSMADRVETVLFALSKTDAYRGWRQVLDANAALLAEHAPRFADAVLHPVSARMFEMAAKAPTEQAATMLRQSSGVLELQGVLQEQLIGKAAMLGEANTLRALETAFAEQNVLLQAERRALNTGESEVAALRQRRDELSGQRRSSTRGWQLKLRAEIQRARLDCTHDVARQMRDLQAWFRQRVDSADRDALDGLPGEVDSALKVVAARVTAQLDVRLNEVASASLAELFTRDELDLIRAQLARSDHPQVVIRPPEARQATAEDKVLIGMGGYMGVMGSVGIGKIGLGALGVASSGLVLAPVIALGLGAGWWIGRTRKHASNKQHVKQWLTEAIADARSALDQAVSEQIINAEHELQLALDDALTKRIDAIEAEIAEVDKVLKMGAQERSKQLGVLGKQIKDVAAAREQVGNLLTRITGVGRR